MKNFMLILFLHDFCVTLSKYFLKIHFDRMALFSDERHKLFKRIFTTNVLSFITNMMCYGV